ncbi:MAG: phage holin family protein [Chloroflexia bacterium]
MKTFILRWAVIVIAVLLVAWGLPQIGIFGNGQLVNYGNDWVTLAIFAGVLALLNTFVKPILVILSIPFTCLTMGLFMIVINTALFALAAWLVPSFSVGGFWGALVGAIAVSIVGMAVNMLTGEKMA